MPVCLSVHPAIHPSIHLFIHPFLNSFIHLTLNIMLSVKALLLAAYILSVVLYCPFCMSSAGSADKILCQFAWLQEAMPPLKVIHLKIYQLEHAKILTTNHRFSHIMYISLELSHSHLVHSTASKTSAEFSLINSYPILFMEVSWTFSLQEVCREALREATNFWDVAHHKYNTQKVGEFPNHFIYGIYFPLVYTTRHQQYSWDK